MPIASIDELVPVLLGFIKAAGRVLRCGALERVDVSEVVRHTSGSRCTDDNATMQPSTNMSSCETEKLLQAWELDRNRSI